MQLNNEHRKMLDADMDAFYELVAAEAAYEEASDKEKDARLTYNDFLVTTPEFAALTVVLDLNDILTFSNMPAWYVNDKVLTKHLLMLGRMCSEKEAKIAFLRYAYWGR